MRVRADGVKCKVFKSILFEVCIRILIGKLAPSKTLCGGIMSLIRRPNTILGGKCNTKARSII